MARKPRRVTIRPGAYVGMDHRQWTWPEVPRPKGLRAKCMCDLVFVAEVLGNTLKLTRPHFGILGGNQYGNGAIHANPKDVRDKTQQERGR